MVFTDATKYALCVAAAIQSFNFLARVFITKPIEEKTFVVIYGSG